MMNSPISSSDHAKLISLLEGTISDEDFHDLEADLRQRPELRAAWIELHDQECELRHHFSFPARLIPEQSKKIQHLWPVFALAACFVFVAYFDHSKTKDFNPNKIDTVAQSESARIITSIENLDWVNDQKKGVHLDLSLEPGTLRILEGKMELSLLSGAKVAIDGPAEIQILSERVAYLNRVEEIKFETREESGFTLSTPDRPEIDLGLEFAVHVDDTGASQFRVFANDLDEPKHACPKPYHGPCPICEF